MADLLIMRRLRRRQRQRERISRFYRHRGNLIDVGDTEFIQRYRLDKSTFFFLCDALRKKLERRPFVGYPIEFQVLSTLKFLGTGSFQSVVADDFFTASSQSTISRNIDAVCDAVYDVLRQLTYFPLHPEGIRKIKEGFYARGPIPNIVGAIDCTHILIQRPLNADFHMFMNRKGTYSLNIQVVCDHEMRIVDIVAKWPGSTHDSHIWKMSGLHRIISGMFPAHNFLLGDSGYPLEPWLLTPFINPQTAEAENFNKIHSSLRSVVERCIGLLKSRFRCLHKTGGTLAYQPDKVCKIIFAAAVLHNLCINRNVDIDEIIEDF